jgi:hypothetical protein
MHLVAYHPDFAWPSQYNSRYPGNHRVSFLARLVDYPPFSGPWKFKRYVPVHSEAYPFWTHLFYGFASPVRDLEAGDVSAYTRERFRDAVSGITRAQGKKRFIAEYSGWSRIELFKAIFPDAQFIHIVRDGRAVANSLTHVSWWRGWQGIHQWRWGVPPEELLAKWEEYDRSFVALAAIHWKILVRNILDKSRRLSEKELLVVRYEDLVADPHGKALECIRFCGLDAESARFRRHLGTVEIVNANQTKFRIPSWKSNLTAAQIEMVEDICGDELAHFGYLPVKVPSGEGKGA